VTQDEFGGIWMKKGLIELMDELMDGWMDG
jgi:hypothetical protein